MYRALVLCAAIVLAAGLAIHPTAAQPDVPSGVYRLNDLAEYQFGCFPPCLCPIWMTDSIRGTFKLVDVPDPDVTVNRYEVRQLLWLVDLEEPATWITGTGAYSVRRNTDVPYQRMELDLTIGENDPEHFDSGWVAFDPSTTPGIDIWVSINGMYCLDTAIRVAADRVPENEIPRYTLGRRSRYQEGCWDPCDCPLLMPVPVYGGFGLVDLGGDIARHEWALVDLRWRIVRDNAYDDITAVDGVGLYIFHGDFIAQRQMQLALSFDGGELMSFDSGILNEPPTFDRIDITLTMNNFVCFDRVFYLHARRLSWLAEVSPYAGDAK